MMTTRFFGYPNYAAYKAAFVASARKREIDLETGATSFQVVLLKAAQSVDTHHQRMAAAVRANAERYNPDVSYYYWDSNDVQNRGRVTLRRLRWVHWDNGAGATDAEKVDRQARRNWWHYRDYWHGRCAVNAQTQVSSIVLELYGLIPPPDVEALFNIRRECGAADPQQSVFMEAWRASRLDKAAARMLASMKAQQRTLSNVIQSEIGAGNIIN